MTGIAQATIPILSTDGCQQSELTVPHHKLREAGANVDDVSPAGAAIRGWDEGGWGGTVEADLALRDAAAADDDALVLPGGQVNPDLLRAMSKAATLVRDFAVTVRTVAAICHVPSLLIEAGGVARRDITGIASIRTDLLDADSRPVERGVFAWGRIVTSRGSNDPDGFVGAIADRTGKAGQGRAAA